jgi:hypothetical protein
VEDFSIFDASGRVTTNFVRSVFLFRRIRSLISLNNLDKFRVTFEAVRLAL